MSAAATHIYIISIYAIYQRMHILSIWIDHVWAIFSCNSGEFPRKQEMEWLFFQKHRKIIAPKNGARPWPWILARGQCSSDRRKKYLRDRSLKNLPFALNHRIIFFANKVTSLFTLPISCVINKIILANIQYWLSKLTSSASKAKVDKKILASVDFFSYVKISS